VLGPLWVIAGPAVFVLVLGELFRHVTAHANELFVPYLAAGLIIWNYITNIVNTAPRLYVLHRASLLHGPANHANIVLKVICNSGIIFLYQSIVILVVMVLHQVPPTVHWLLILPAAALILAHSVWVLVVLGLIGARYRDLAEVVEMMMRVAFLATPIIWMPGEDGRGSVVGVFLAFNPFYHVLEPLRGAILGTPVPATSWIISIVLAAVGLTLASYMYRRFRHAAVLW
jgi:ABC-type polysaccharide/polyol phosphate export permease